MAKRKRMKLPDKLSELLMLALTDLEQAEKESNVEIDMGEWYTKRKGEPCVVCIAGAVMRQELPVPEFSRGMGHFEVIASAYDYPELISQKLLAIDALRKGQFEEAWVFVEPPNSSRRLWQVTDSLPLTYTLRDSFQYADNRTEWWLHMQTIVGILQAEGL